VRHLFLRCTVIALAALGMFATTAKAFDIYSWQTTNDFNDWSLARWDSEGAGTVHVGSGEGLSFDPAFSLTGVLWGVDGSNIFTINTTTGAVGAPRAVTGNIFSLNEFLIGVAFNGSGAMYSWSQRTGGSGIYRINTVTGAATIVTSTSPIGSIFGMTFGPGNTLYASNGTQLFRLDPNTGALLQTVGTFGGTFITSINFGVDGVMRGLAPDFAGNATDMYTINLQTMALTNPQHSADYLYGIATIPAPAGAALLLGCGLIAARRRR